MDSWPSDWPQNMDSQTLVYDDRLPQLLNNRLCQPQNMDSQPSDWPQNMDSQTLVYNNRFTTIAQPQNMDNQALVAALVASHALIIKQLPLPTPEYG